MAKKAPSSQVERLLAAQEQGLRDLAATGASDVVFVREHRAPPSMLFDRLEEQALALGFAVASTAVGHEHGFESLDVVLRGFVAQLRIAEQEERGLVALVDAFAKSAGKRALQRFDDGAEAHGLSGDLARLCRAYVAAREDRTEVKRIRAFLEGREAPPADDDGPLGALTARTAKRTLADLSRLVRALGHAGLVLITRRAGLLTELPPAQREGAYTVLRELVDNADGPRGAIATRVYVSGGDELFDSRRAISENAPLATRTLDDLPEAARAIPLPHATVVHLQAPEIEPEPVLREPDDVGPHRRRALAAIIRASMGLPPLDLLAQLTVGYESVDAALDKLFEHTENAGSVFSLLSGDYGTGKTHMLLHVTARALSERRPVLRLSVERLDTDLGNPQRHLRRLIEGALLPGIGAPSPLDRLEHWRASDAGARKLRKALLAVGEGEGDAAAAANKAMREWGVGERELSVFMGAFDLESKAGNPNYRQDAYGRLLLWLELLERLDGTAGPLVLIDEAENLYRGGTSRPERRTALRSLAFYCGGSLPRACVIFAVTPETLGMLREEAEAMLDDITEQRTVLSCEDVTMLRRRLLRARPIEVARLSKDGLTELATRVRAVHASARGAVRDAEWGEFVAGLVSHRPTPREVVRGAVTRLETLWWSGLVVEDGA